MDQPDTQNRRRSQRVLLEIAVYIRAQMPNGNRVQAQAFTQVVNAHGGLLEATFRMTPGQKITLVNPHSGREAGCHIVRVEELPDGCFATAFEFDQRSPQFWPISFPPLDWGLAQEVANEKS